MTTRSHSSILRQLLELERECCSALCLILERERVAASAHDLSALLSSNKEREATQARWERIANQRRDFVRRTGVRLVDLANEDESLEALRVDVETSTREIARAQRVNHGLVQAVLRQVSGLIETIRRELPSSRYDKGAAITTPMPGARRAAWSA